MNQGVINLRCAALLGILLIGCAASPQAGNSLPVVRGTSAPGSSAVAPASSAPSSAPADSASKVVVSRPTLRVGTSGDYAPFSTLTGGGSASGFDAELAQAMSHDLGFEVEWSKFRWPELATRVVAGDFDLVMSGVTWLPDRAVSGYLTRSVAHGGPCVIGATDAQRLGVNHGGVLESWARRAFSGRELVVVDDNQSLPSLLASGQVQAIVTDNFERLAFARPSDAVRCEAPVNQKVYWVAPARAKDVGPRLDAWLRDHPATVRAAQSRWFGETQRLDAVTHLVDLLTRRFAFMPLVAAQKNARHLPIEDLPREREVLGGVEQSALRMGLPRAATTELFRVQIELSKAVQRRQSQPTSLDLGTQIRPALTALGEAILDALAEARAAHEEPTAADLQPLAEWLTESERQQLLSALLAASALAPSEAN